MFVKYIALLIVGTRFLRRKLGLPIADLSAARSAIGKAVAKIEAALKPKDYLICGYDGQQLGAYYEGLENEAYPDPATGGDPWTCGIGCTGTDGDGNTIGPGTYWSDEKAYSEFSRRMSEEFGPCVNEVITVPMTQKEFDAMEDLCFNVGVGNFSSSTLAKKFNAGDKQGAADQFPEWNLADGQVMKGLERRRWAERHVFLGGTAKDGIAEAEAKYP